MAYWINDEIIKSLECDLLSISATKCDDMLKANIAKMTCSTLKDYFEDYEYDLSFLEIIWTSLISFSLSQ